MAISLRVTQGAFIWGMCHDVESTMATELDSCPLFNPLLTPRVSGWWLGYPNHLLFFPLNGQKCPQAQGFGLKLCVAVTLVICFPFIPIK